MTGAGDVLEGEGGEMGPVGLLVVEFVVGGGGGGQVESI